MVMSLVGNSDIIRVYIQWIKCSQVPIEVEQGGLAVFKRNIIAAIQQAIHNQNGEDYE